MQNIYYICNALLRVQLLPSKNLICFKKNFLIMMEDAFYFTLKSLFILKDIYFFGHVGKRFVKNFQCQNLWRQLLWSKLLQYTFFPISQEVKIMKFGLSVEYDLRVLFFKNYAESRLGRLVRDLFFRPPAVARRVL